jgi:hypothetical protein
MITQAERSGMKSLRGCKPAPLPDRMRLTDRPENPANHEK